jgi:hypothetical protein
VRTACQVLGVGELRTYRWLGRRAADQLADQAPGGSPMHGLLEWEVAEIVRLFEAWARSTDPTASSPTAAPTGSGVGVAGQRAPRAGAPGPADAAAARPGRSLRKPFPDWVDYQPGSIWIDDPTHFTRAGVAATVVEDLVSRKCWPSWSAPARTAWSTPPWTTLPGRCCWPSATFILSGVLMSL